MTPDGPNMGVVLGDDDRDVLMACVVDRAAKNEVGNRKYRDDDLTAKLTKMSRSAGDVQFEVHRVPKPMATLVGKIKGKMLKRYTAIQDVIAPAIAQAAERVETDTLKVIFENCTFSAG